MQDKITALCAAMVPQAIAWRHQIHRCPELGFHETETTRLITEFLESLGNIEVQRPLPTGAVGILKGKKPGMTLAFRADIDALPITEDESHDPRSACDGVMHACGHDAHTATLLSAAAVLSQLQEEICGEIRFIFQPAEEAPPGGGCKMVEAGAVDGVDYIFALHGHVPADPGMFFVKSGPLFASSYNFDIELTGKQAHAAFPFNGIDSILTASQIIAALNTLIPRSVDNSMRAVLTVTQIHGGNTHNVIPEKVSFGGTIRMLDSRCEETILERVKSIAEHTARMNGAQCSVVFDKGYALVDNDAKAAEAVRRVLTAHYGQEHVTEPVALMGGEDFSAYLKKVPGCYYRIGIRKVQEDGSVHQPHTSRYIFNDEAFNYSIESVVRILLEAQNIIAGL